MQFWIASRTWMSQSRPGWISRTSSQVPYEGGQLLGGDDRDIVDAELVEETDEPGGLR